MYSSCVPSHPALFQFGDSLADFFCDLLVGASIFVKCSVMMFAFAESVPPKFPSSSCTYSSLFLFLFFSFLIAA